jgi:hypothetical protein
MEILRSKKGLKNVPSKITLKEHIGFKMMMLTIKIIF